MKHYFNYAPITRAHDKARGVMLVRDVGFGA
jgi:hypothetical protein